MKKRNLDKIFGKFLLIKVNIISLQSVEILLDTIIVVYMSFFTVTYEVTHNTRDKKRRIKNREREREKNNNNSFLN